MKFRPCIDLHNGCVKQIVGGTLNDGDSLPKENFVAKMSSSYFAELYKKDNLYGGHVIMLGPGNKEAAIEALEAFPGGLQLGGGITPDNASFFLDHGASHIIVTSYVFQKGKINWSNLEAIVKAVGKNRLVLDLSCRKVGNDYLVFTDKWQKPTEFVISPLNLDKLASFCSEFLVHAADVEGQMKGIQLELVELLGKWQKIPVTYAGGISQLSDLELINQASSGTLDYTIGSALDIFGGSITYSDVVRMNHLS